MNIATDHIFQETPRYPVRLDEQKRELKSDMQYALEPHRRAARMLGYVLTLGTKDAWFGLRLVLRKRLTLEERVCLAFVALRALDPEDAAKTAAAALGCDSKGVD